MRTLGGGDVEAGRWGTCALYTTCFCLGASTSLGTQRKVGCQPSPEELDVSLSVPALQDCLGLGTCRQQLEQFGKVVSLGVATLKLSRMQILREN